MNDISHDNLRISSILLTSLAPALLLGVLLLLTGDTIFQEFISVAVFMIPVYSVSLAMKDRTRLEFTPADQRKKLESLHQLMQEAKQWGMVTFIILVISYVTGLAPVFEPILFVVKAICASCWYGIYLGRLHYDLILAASGEKDQYALEDGWSKNFSFWVPIRLSPSSHDIVSPPPTSWPQAPASLEIVSSPPTTSPNSSTVYTVFQSASFVLIMALLGFIAAVPLSFVAVLGQGIFSLCYVCLPFLPIFAFYHLYHIATLVQEKLNGHKKEPLPIKLLMASMWIDTLAAVVTLVLWLIFRNKDTLISVSWPTYMVAFCLSLLSVGYFYVQCNSWHFSTGESKNTEFTKKQELSQVSPNLPPQAQEDKPCDFS